MAAGIIEHGLNVHMRGCPVAVEKAEPEMFEMAAGGGVATYDQVKLACCFYLHVLFLLIIGMYQ